jgi:hypothetical protein
MQDREEETQRPVVVVSGLPRSGTSMVMGMLSAGGLELVTDGVRQADADNPLGYYEFEPVKDLEGGGAAWLGAAAGKGVKIISFLLRTLPDDYEYKIVFVRRGIAEVLASQRRMLLRRGEAAGGTGDDEMARLFVRHLEKVEAELQQRPNCEVLYIEHRETLAAPARIAGDISRFLGLPLDVARMAGVVDNGLYRNRG